MNGTYLRTALIYGSNSYYSNYYFADYDFQALQAWIRKSHREFVKSLALLWDYQLMRRFALTRPILRIIKQPRWKKGRWRSKT